MVWILLMLVGVAVLIHLGTRGKSTQQQIDEIRAGMQKDRDDFERRHGRPAPF